MAPSKTQEEPTLTLPVGHPQAGYVEPDLSYHEGTGALPDEEIEFHEARNEAREEEVKRVAENEHKVAQDEQDKRDDHAAQQRELLEKVAAGEATFEQISQSRIAQATLDATEEQTTTTTTRSSGASSSGAASSKSS